MNNVNAVFAAIRQAIITAGMEVPAGMPATALPLDGGKVWSAVIPVTDWCNNDLYKDHLFNRDDEKKIIKKDHLKGAITTDVQRTVVACLDSEGQMTKLDGHCRAKAWNKGTLEKPACGSVICIIHVLPEGETPHGVYVQTLLKHAINKAGRLTATEEKAAAQKWAGAESGFVPKSWFVESSISKAAIDASKAGDAVISKALDVAIKTPDGLGKDLMENLRVFQPVREMAESFNWDKPVGNTVKTDEDGVTQVKLTTEERKADRQGKEWTKGASVAAIMLSSSNLNIEAAKCFWYNYGLPSSNQQAANIWDMAYKLGSTGGQVNANEKAKLVEYGCLMFVEWYQEVWAGNEEAKLAEYQAFIDQAKAAQEEKEAQEKHVEEQLAAIEQERPIVQQVFGGDVVELGQLDKPKAFTLDELEAMQEEARQAGDEAKVNSLQADIDKLLAE